MATRETRAEALALEHLDRYKKDFDELNKLTNDELKQKDIDCLCLDVRTHNLLIKSGIKKIGDFLRFFWNDIVNIKRMGPCGLMQLRYTLRYIGFLTPDGRVATASEPFMLPDHRELGREPKREQELRSKKASYSSFKHTERHYLTFELARPIEPSEHFFMHPDTRDMLLFMDVNYKEFGDFTLLLHQITPHLFRVEDYYGILDFGRSMCFPDEKMKRDCYLFCFVWRGKSFLPFRPDYSANEDKFYLSEVPMDSKEGGERERSWRVFLEMAAHAVRHAEAHLPTYFYQYSQDRCGR